VSDRILAILWFLTGFTAGSLPFSLWLALLFTGVDIRNTGDGNPGASNAWRAGGWRVGLPALLLDFFKGAIPVWLAHFGSGLEGLPLAAVALAPVLGHSFSPFLGLHGGKAIATTFGIWTGLLPPGAPFVLGLALAVFMGLRFQHARAALLGMACLLVYLLLAGEGPALLAAWLGNFTLLVWKHRRALWGNYETFASKH
jgi:glycerol-3-phosphate acyltransferase PlsY